MTTTIHWTDEATGKAVTERDGLILADCALHDLYFALIAMRDACGPSVAGFDGWAPVYAQAIGKAQSAIAKAEGGAA